MWNKIKTLLLKVPFFVFLVVNLKAVHKRGVHGYVRYFGATIRRIAQQKAKSRLYIAADMFIKCLLTTAEFTDYATLQFYRIPLHEARAYLTKGRFMKMQRYLCSPRVRNLLTEKRLFLAEFHKFAKRDFFFITDNTESNELADFTNQHRVFIAKPRSSNQGQGIERLDSSCFSDIEALLDYLREKNTLLLEELIENHEVLKKFSDRSLNTVRIIAIRTESGVKVICSYLRFNTVGGITDSNATGGFACPVESETGRLFGGLIDFKHSLDFREPIHPSGFPIDGEYIPFWKETIEMVTNATILLKEAFFVPWDIAVTQEGPVVVEGNVNSGFGWQMISGIPVYEDMKKAYKFAKKCHAGSRTKSLPN